MERIADALLAKHSGFVASMAKVKAQFGDQGKPVSPEVVRDRLEAIWPAFIEIAGSLTGPSTIANAIPTPCQAAAKSSKFSGVVIRNDTDTPVAIQRAPDRPTLFVRERSWRTFNVPVGSSLILPDGKCLLAQEEPTMFVMGKRP